MSEHYMSIAPDEMEHKAALCDCKLVREEHGRVKLIHCKMHAAATTKKKKKVEEVTTVDDDYRGPSEPLATLLHMAVKKGGTYDPDEIMCFVEEQMTGGEAEDAWEFLGWCHRNDKKFGSENLPTVWKEWEDSLRKARTKA
jgi:hypothetical protein